MLHATAAGEIAYRRAMLTILSLGKVKANTLKLLKKTTTTNSHEALLSSIAPKLASKQQKHN